MHDFEVIPLVGIGPVQFGMSRAESRAALGLTPEELFKSPDEPATDAYFNFCFQVFFNALQQVEYIELSRRGAVRAIFLGTDVLSLEAEESIQLIGTVAEFDPDHPELGYSYVFPALELALWRPVMPQFDDGEVSNPTEYRFETLGIGCRGYFSDFGS